jgi:TonB family protein
MTLLRVGCGWLGLLCVMAYALTPICVEAQDATPAPTAVPAPSAATASAPAAAVDGNALMVQAAKANGLTAADMQPWHLKATFKTIDGDGKPKDDGTFEELWVSPTKYKRTYVVGELTRTEYGTAKGAFTAGAEQLAQEHLMEMEREFVDPLPDPQLIAKVPFSVKLLGSGTLNCLDPQGDSGVPRALAGWTYCLAHDKPVLRASVSAGSHTQYVHNHIVNFQGRFVASDLQFMQGDKTVFTAHMESIEPLKETDEALFQPPADARVIEVKAAEPDTVAPPKRIELPAAIANKQLLNHPKPVYPPFAQTIGASGNVVLKATLSTEGKVITVGVLSGVPLLQQAAIDCARKWTYKPFLLNGEAVEVNTSITIYFSPLAPRAF